MATIKLLPSTYYLSNSSYLSVSNASNMYTDTDSDTYATVTNSRTSTSSYYIYLRGFDFDSIPANAIINSFTISFKARESGVSTSTSYRPYLCDGTTTITGSCDVISTTAAVHTFTGVTADWEDIVGYGSDFGIRINCRRSSRNTTSYMYIYGAEIEVDYTIPNPSVVTSTLTGNGSIDPNGATSMYIDEEYTITIIPTNNSDEVHVTLDGTDVTSSLVTHTGSDTQTQVPGETFTTGFSDNDADFYMSSSQTGTDYFEYAIGHSAEDPYTGSSNTYVKDGNNNTAYGWINYHFDFSEIPATAEIDSVEVRVYGARENSTIDSTHMARIGCYSGSTLKGTEEDFTSTSNYILTIEDPGTWTRAELQDAQVRFYVAYYGGHVGGISFEVTYHTDTVYYTYTFTTTSATHTVAVVIGASDKLWFKDENTWFEAAKAWKKINGSWIEQSDLTGVFNANTNYVRGGS